MRDLFVFVNHLDCDKCQGSRTTKSSSQVPDVITLKKYRVGITVLFLARLYLSMGSFNQYSEI